MKKIIYIYFDSQRASIQHGEVLNISLPDVRQRETLSRKFLSYFIIILLYIWNIVWCFLHFRAFNTVKILQIKNNVFSVKFLLYTERER